MVTVIRKKFDDINVTERSHPSGKNWLKLDHPQFLSELKALLATLSILSFPTTHTDIELLDSNILTAMTTALNNSSPDRIRAFKHKSWWNPVTMPPLRKAAAKA